MSVEQDNVAGNQGEVNIFLGRGSLRGTLGCDPWLVVRWPGEPLFDWSGRLAEIGKSYYVGSIEILLAAAKRGPPGRG